MIAILVCSCPSAPMKIRKFLQQNGVEDWISYPISIGKESAYQALANMPDGREEIQRFIKDKARYIIIIGYTEDHLEWADIAHGEPTRIADAELILERFA